MANKQTRSATQQEIDNFLIVSLMITSPKVGNEPGQVQDLQFRGRHAVLFLETWGQTLYNHTHSLQHTDVTKMDAKTAYTWTNRGRLVIGAIGTTYTVVSSLCVSLADEGRSITVAQPDCGCGH
jgi:hypothetical protein